MHKLTDISYPQRNSCEIIEYFLGGKSQTFFFLSFSFFPETHYLDCMWGSWSVRSLVITVQHVKRTANGSYSNSRHNNFVALMGFKSCFHSKNQLKTDLKKDKVYKAKVTHHHFGTCWGIWCWPADGLMDYTPYSTLSKHKSVGVTLRNSNQLRWFPFIVITVWI